MAEWPTYPSDVIGFHYQGGHEGNECRKHRDQFGWSIRTA